MNKQKCVCGDSGSADERAATATSATYELTPQGQRYNRPPWREAHTEMCTKYSGSHANDPSAGSPTETLLRLLLPLSDKVH